MSNERAGRNRLAGEKSPYLLQHANNPVDWYPWGEEAFQQATRKDKPIFLSIGYSTCHWCHVMERESFEDTEVARLMNDAFVAIKVDREERPEIDNIYMTACQMVTGGGGWPLTIIMTPEKEPFFAATYIPKISRFGRKGMVDLIPEIEDLWRTKREELLSSAHRLVEAISKMGSASSGSSPGEETFHQGFNQLAVSFDRQHGGFGRGMKFPMPHQILFLLRYWHRTGNWAALQMAKKTLTGMRGGGIYDHLGFGFHRYATDASWLVPHFEKMLYDQALLLLAYAEGYLATGEELYGRTVREIATYVLRDMASPQGAFYSAEDADSEGEEGRFYLWREAEIREHLDAGTADLIVDTYGISAGGNFADEASGNRTGDNILHLRGSLAPELDGRLEAARKVLFENRQTRVHPLKDDKVLTDWNGLMIGALATASRVVGEEAYARAAEKAAAFIRDNLTLEDGRLLHRYRDGEAAIPATLDDYAFYVFGLIELYETTFDSGHLTEAIRLNGLMLEHFADPAGGFFLSAGDAEGLIVRSKALHDSAIPSGNSVATWNLLRLAQMTGDANLEQQAASAARAFSSDVERAPAALAMFLTALDFALGPSLAIVIAGDPESADTREMLDAIRRAYAPRKVVLLRPEGTETEIAGIAPFIKDQTMLDGKATAYVCVNRACSLPTTDPQQMLELIEEKAKGNDGSQASH